MRRDLVGFGDFEDFDVGVVQLHDVVLRAPRMAIARADLEAGARIEFRRRVEIADRVHDMIETARHLTGPLAG